MFERYNRTELYQLARAAGLEVLPTDSKQLLAQYLSGELDPPKDRGHPGDRWRLGIIGFLSNYWSSIHAQLKCPARNMRHPDLSKRDERPCFGCVDQQVIACVALNKKNEATMRRFLPVVTGPDRT